MISNGWTERIKELEEENERLKYARCRNCVSKDDETGVCMNANLRDKFTPILFGNERGQDKLTYLHQLVESDKGGGYFCVGSNFGCVHFKKR